MLDSRFSSQKEMADRVWANAQRWPMAYKRKAAFMAEQNKAAFMAKQKGREIMVNVQSSVTGQYWQIVVNGQVVEGFAKRGHGKATRAQVEAIAETYREQV